MPKSPITYYSTNGNAPNVDFQAALLHSQPPDKGLYYPGRIPRFSPREIADMKGMDYPEIAFSVLHKFLGGEVPRDALRKMTREAYDFEVPLEHVEGRKYLMRLDRGPTASFKDFAARFLGRIVQHFCASDSVERTVIVATSGDTGGAMANAFYGLKGIRVVVLLPEKEVTGLQRRQMTTLGKNVTAVVVEGKFDDCQRLAKSALADPVLSPLNLISANSINIGRLLPQAAYYFYAYSRLANSGKITFSVPSGNFGNVCAGMIGREMGLPAGKFIIAVNENDEFPKFLDTGKYSPIVPSRACISNAMNVGHPSNLARIVNMYGGILDEKGVLVKAPDLKKMRGDIYSTSISDAATKKAIKRFYQEYGKILEPHGAVAWAGVGAFEKKHGGAGLCVSLETADPAKFPEAVREVLGISPQLPKSMQGLEKKKEQFVRIGTDYGTAREFLKEFMRH